MPSKSLQTISEDGIVAADVDTTCPVWSGGWRLSLRSPSFGRPLPSET